MSKSVGCLQFCQSSLQLAFAFNSTGIPEGHIAGKATSSSYKSKVDTFFKKNKFKHPNFSLASFVGVELNSQMSSVGKVNKSAFIV